MGQSGADEIDLTHPLSLDRCRPLLVGAFSQRYQEGVARRVCNGIERRQGGEERSKLIDLGGVGLVGASGPADVDDIVAVLSQGLLHGGTDGPIPNDNDFHDSLLEGLKTTVATTGMTADPTRPDPPVTDTCLEIPTVPLTPRSIEREPRAVGNSSFLLWWRA